MKLEVSYFFDPSLRPRILGGMKQLEPKASHRLHGFPVTIWTHLIWRKVSFLYLESNCELTLRTLHAVHAVIVMTSMIRTAEWGEGGGGEVVCGLHRGPPFVLSVFGSLAA